MDVTFVVTASRPPEHKPILPSHTLLHSRAPPGRPGLHSPYQLTMLVKSSSPLFGRSKYLLNTIVTVFRATIGTTSACYVWPPNPRVGLFRIGPPSYLDRLSYLFLLSYLLLLAGLPPVS